MKRNTYEGVHSAQVSFPGGKVEAFDQNFLATAIRETHEEFGFSNENYQIIRELTELYIPPSNFMVYPFLGIMKSTVEIIPNPDEVVEIIEMPLSFLLNDQNIVPKKISTSYSVDIEVPVFELNGKVIWGATAMILCELKDLIISAKN
jgi:8-oxo-dGTP pyrophosphatase MutT (NUDIX family)